MALRQEIHSLVESLTACTFAIWKQRHPFPMWLSPKQRLWTATCGEDEIELAMCHILSGENCTSIYYFDKLCAFLCRTILLAYRDVTDVVSQDNAASAYVQELENDLTLVAITGIADPLRPEVVNAIKQCNRAGITVRMLTGRPRWVHSSYQSQDHLKLFSAILFFYVCIRWSGMQRQNNRKTNGWPSFETCANNVSVYFCFWILVVVLPKGEKENSVSPNRINAFL